MTLRLLQAIMGIMRDSTRILVTHQLQYLPQADVIFVLEGGRITARGSHAELSQQGIDLHSFQQSEAQPGAALSSRSFPLHHVTIMSSRAVWLSHAEMVWHRLGMLCTFESPGLVRHSLAAELKARQMQILLLAHAGFS